MVKHKRTSTQSSKPRIQLRNPKQDIRCLLTSLNRRSEDVCVFAVIVAELELSDIERKVLFADLVEGADAAALNQRPEAFNRVGMDRADNVIALGMIDNDVRIFL